MDIFANFDPNRHFSEILTKTKIWAKFWTKSILPKILTKIKIHRKCWPWSRFTDNFDPNRDIRFSKTLTKIEIFINIDQNRNFSKILTKIEILNFFYPNQHFSKNLYLINNFCNFVQIQQLGKFKPKSRISDNFDQHRDFLDQVRHFGKFWPKSRIFDNFD